MNRLSLKSVLAGIGLALLLSGPAHAWPQACESAWDALESAGALTEVHELLANNCAILHERGWVPGAGFYNPSICEYAWNELSATGELGSAQTLIEGDCPVLCRNYGWCE